MNHCSSCRFSAPMVTDDNEDVVMICRRYPPQVFPLEDAVACAWPQVEENDTCGEWSDGTTVLRPFDRAMQLLGLRT